MDSPVVLLTGPTASGKSALALELAHRLERTGGATIINADSMQVYQELRILTARPSPDEEAAVPHRLYGILPAVQPWSAAAFRADAHREIAAARAQGRVALVVGGTGLYFRALVDGLAPIPEISSSVRQEARALMDQLGPEAFRSALAARDPESAESLGPRDRQRLIRAWEVVVGTGRSLAAWQRCPPVGGLDGPTVRAVVDVSRDTLYERIDARFVAMFDGGGLAEVEALLARGLAPDLPACRAVGVREMAEYLAGSLDRARAIERGQQATRRLAKRQMTWYRNQITNWPRISQDSESSVNEIFAKIRP
ncbi:MAG: tRNA (adenosine(37)-N6)-dimethylallyltransferase MiaA [Proteobacteria bacterium]|nr:tRNA (adenosine(37)-N6)-dimethylallyltransferase MiaA [Pseudomonadota bacterium]MDA1059102.1 tRNA (adenosine(37)-N6)-dimethylallyltransferase MiaA [Pseudomonadota bacterium]